LLDFLSALSLPVYLPFSPTAPSSSRSPHLHRIAPQELLLALPSIQNELPCALPVHAEGKCAAGDEACGGRLQREDGDTGAAAWRRAALQAAGDLWRGAVEPATGPEVGGNMSRCLGDDRGSGERGPASSYGRA
jgi:hypothetical protein